MEDYRRSLEQVAEIRSTRTLVQELDICGHRSGEAGRDVPAQPSALRRSRQRSGVAAASLAIASWSNVSSSTATWVEIPRSCMVTP